MTMFYGQRNANEGNADELAGRLRHGPTGRQLATDGSFVHRVVEEDPATLFLMPPNGFTVVWNHGGTLENWTFTRDTGWQQV